MPTTQLFTFHLNDALVTALLQQEVRFLVVGGFAVKLYAPEREADDLDLMVEQTPENATRLFQAFSHLGITPGFSKELISSPSERPQQLALKMGYYADLVTTGREVEFETEWNMASEARLGTSQVRVASRDLLIRQKQKAGREKDLKDVVLLERGA